MAEPLFAYAPYHFRPPFPHPHITSMPALRNSRTTPESASPLGCHPPLPLQLAALQPAAFRLAALRLAAQAQPPKPELQAGAPPAGRGAAVEHHPRRSSAPRAAEARSSSRHKTPVGAKIGAKLAAFQISDTASPKSVTPKETTPKATSPEATLPPPRHLY